MANNCNTDQKFNNVELLPQTPYLLSLMTSLRDRNTTDSAFVNTAHQVARLLIQQALNHVPMISTPITTAAGADYEGVKHAKGVCGISILRAGACLEQPLRECWSGPLGFGQILIQRDPESHRPVYLYSKFPSGFQEQTILLLEPMLATGGSACCAIERLLDQGVKEENTIFVNFVASKKGVEVLGGKFPGLRIVSAAVDGGLDSSEHIIPGLGDFGDRFYGTE